MSASILFLHTNYPGQFKYISEELASKNYDIKFMCDTNYKELNNKIDVIVLRSSEDSESIVEAIFSILSFLIAMSTCDSTFSLITLQFLRTKSYIIYLTQIHHVRLLQLFQDHLFQLLVSA